MEMLITAQEVLMVLGAEEKDGPEGGISWNQVNNEGGIMAPQL